MVEITSLQDRRSNARSPAYPSMTPTPHAEPEPLRVLVLSHLDPRVSKGGAEIASFQLFEELRSRPNVSAWFLAASAHKVPGREGVTFGQPFGPDNFIYYSQGFNDFNFSNPHAELRGELTELLQELRPNVVHFHHYLNFGIEVLFAIRAALPDAVIVLSLHEYLAICNSQGQMVKQGSFTLCDGASPRACHACFPNHSPQDFFLRERFVKRFLGVVDAFVAPSAFLAGRYVAWGLDPARVHVVENGVPGHVTADRPMPPFDQSLVFGFFGQISKLKGIEILFEAVDQLGPYADRIQVEIHGDVSGQPAPVQKRFAELLAAAPRNIRFVGPYQNDRVSTLMQSVHAVIVPSIWWENSPLVIQEALANRRPVLCSDIGGMAEKVRDGIDGFHFRVGNGWSLATLLRRLADDPARLLQLQETMALPPTLAETTDTLIALYASARVAVDPVPTGA